MAFHFKALIGIISIVFALPATATETYYSSSFCAPEKQILSLQNPTRTSQKIWSQVRRPNGTFDEIQFEVKAFGKSDIKTSDFLNDSQSFALKLINNQSLKIKASCEDGPEWNPSLFTSPEVRHAFPAGTRSIKFSLQNLSLKKQKVQLQALRPDGSLIDTREVLLTSGFETAFAKFSFQEDVRELFIQGAERLNSQVFYVRGNSELPSPGFLKSPAKLNPADNLIYFLVSTKTRDADESFVIALQDPALIATARDQLGEPPFGKIIVGGIEPGNGGFNRNFHARDKAPYTWFVSRVDAFADFAHIDCDGSPELIEERLEQRLSEGGRICFWRYRVVRELTLDEVRSGILK